MENSLRVERGVDDLKMIHKYPKSSYSSTRLAGYEKGESSNKRLAPHSTSKQVKFQKKQRNGSLNGSRTGSQRRKLDDFFDQTDAWLKRRNAKVEQERKASLE